MMSNKVLFVIGTQGHLINSMAIMSHFATQGVKYEYHFLNLLRGEKSTTGIENFNFDSAVNIFDIAYPEQDIKKKFSVVLSEEYDRVFIYLEFYFINAYLALFYKRKGSIICLANDGNRPYYKVNRRAYKSKVFETLKFYKNVFINKLKPIPIYIYTLTYGKLKYIDEYWMPFKPSVDWAHFKNVVIYDLSNVDFLNKLNQSFSSIKKLDLLPQYENIIFYTNNILYRDKVYAAEIDGLKQIIKNTKAPLIIKMHPTTPDFQEEAFRKISDYVFKSSVPAEFFLLKIKNSIILSGWSSSLLIEVKANNNKYYWLYQYMISKKLPIQDLVDFSLPGNHIIHPLDLNDIKL